MHRPCDQTPPIDSTVPPGRTFVCGRDKRATPLENRVFEKVELHRQRVNFNEVAPHHVLLVHRRGAVKSLQSSGARTASGLLSQPLEIKYRKPRGGGPSKVCEFLGEQPPGVSAGDFFSRTSKSGWNSGTRFASGSPAAATRRVLSKTCSAPSRYPDRATERSPRIFFRTCGPRPRGASQSSAGSPGRPRGSATQIFASFEKLFLVRDASEKLPRNSGWGVAGDQMGI